jgi:cobaltochelatase CobN
VTALLARLMLLLIAVLGLVPPAQAQTDQPRIAFIYDGGESTGPAELRRAADLRADEASIDIYAPGDGGLALTATTDLTQYDLVVLDGTAQGLSLSTARAAAVKAKTQLLVIGGDGSLQGNVDAAAHPDVAAYWANRSVDNDSALIRYLATKVLERRNTKAIVAPVIYPDQGFYHPAAPALFPDRAGFIAWSAARRDGKAFDPAKLTLGLIAHRIQVQQRNVAHIDALIAEAESQDLNIITLVRKGDADFSALIENGKPVIDALIFDGEFLALRDREGGREQAKKLGVPVLMAISAHARTPDEYRASPGGIAPDLTARVVNSERDGLIEPIVIAGRDESTATRRAVPMAEQIAWRVARAKGWARLHHAANADKRIVFTYWSEAGGKADIGADPDDFLDVQGSLAKLLPMMRVRGYNVGAGETPNAEEMAVRMSRKASNVGGWAPGELAKMVEDGEVALLPEARYLEWYRAIPAKRRAEIEAMWGPPPGKTMVHIDRNGQRSIVIPRLEIGNIIVAPHPMWGYYENEKVLMSKDALPPHHQYLAFFLYMQKEWKADAWVSLFSNIVLQPGKSEGPLADDHIGIELGGIPHIHPERLGATGGMSNKRKALAQTIGWYNIVVPLDKTGATGPWGGKILGTAPQGDVMAQMVTGMLGADLEAALEPFGPDAASAALDLVRAVLTGGQTPDAALTARFGRSAPDARAVLALATDYAARLNLSPRETEAILESLEGRWIEPGPMGETYRRPDTLPPGRALYNFDQRAIPTPQAVEVGIKQAESLIAAHHEANGGAFPKKLAVVMWSGENAKTGGVNEALVLHLLGARVERNWRGEVTGVVLIPRAELGRPRVDVIVQTSGVYRDHFQDKVALMNDAAQLAAAADEPDNPVAIATREAEAALLAKGETPERAAALARARVFAPAAGAYSPSIQFLAKSGDLRGDEARMADLYTMRMSHAYGGGLYGAEARAGFEANLRRMDGAALSRSSDVNGMLDHPMSAGFLGGLNLAAKKLTGRETMLYVTNQRDMRNVSVQSARSALQTELRTRYFNREWLRENQAHGYDGARTFMLATNHLDLWDTTATKMVESSDWAEVKAVFVDDKLGLDMDRFFDRANPFAQQVLLTNLLGAAKRGHWEASEAELAQIARRLVSSVRDHGPACEASQCRNQKMTDFVQRQLTAQPGGAALINVYKSAIASATADQSAPGAGDARQPGATSSAQNAASADRSKASATPRPPTISQSPHSPNSVTGQIMREIEKVAANAPQLSPSTLAALLIALLALMGFGGWLAGRRSNT